MPSGMGSDRANSAELAASQHQQPTAKSHLHPPEHHIVTLFALRWRANRCADLSTPNTSELGEALAKWRVLSPVPQQESIINGRVEPSTRSRIASNAA